MTIQFNCPKCSKTLQAPADKVGAFVSCPGCKATFPIPQPPVKELDQTNWVEENTNQAPSPQVQAETGVTQGWYYVAGSGRVGPVSLVELQAVAASGQLQPTDMVWKLGMAQWTPATNVAELAPTFASLLPPPLPPVIPASPDFRRKSPKGQRDDDDDYERPVRPRQSSRHDLQPINDQIPREYKERLLPDEMVYHFAYIDEKGGCCSSTKAANNWILVSEQRILYEASVLTTKKTFVRDLGSIPMSKVAFVKASTLETSGCNAKKGYLLTVNSGGGEISVRIPSEAESKRLQRVIDQIISAK